MEERQDREDLVVGLDPHPRNDLADVGHEIAMGEHDALGPAGGARRVRQHRELGGRIEGNLGRRCALTEQISQRQMAFGAVEHEHVLGRDTDQLGGGLGLRQQRRDGEEELGLGIGELLGDVLGGVERVDRGRDATGTKDAVEDGTEGRDVGRMQPDHVADGESARCESACNAVDLCDQRSVCGDCARTALDECRLVEVCGVGVSEQEVVDAEVGDFNVGERTLEAHCAPRKVARRGGVTNLL